MSDSESHNKDIASAVSSDEAHKAVAEKELQGLAGLAGLQRMVSIAVLSCFSYLYFYCRYSGSSLRKNSSKTISNMRRWGSAI